MGMDVYGKSPSSKVGRYFRRNVWGWRPLWEYVDRVHPEIAQYVEYGYSNDGDGLNELRSKMLSELLFEDYNSGKAAEYVAERNRYLSELPREECNLCNSTGIRSDEIGVSNGMHEKELDPEMKILTDRTYGWCNGCGGSGSREPFETNYYLEPEDIKEFAEFLAECGGFEIC